MSGVSGDFSKLAQLAKGLPTTQIAQRVAARAAGEITGRAQATANAGQNAYGDTWAPGVDGSAVDLRRSGRLLADVRYAAVGTRLRAVLGPAYAKFQVGKRPVFPRAGATLPIAYSEALADLASEEIRKELGA